MGATIDQQMQAAAQVHQSGQLDEAISQYRAILAQQPDFAPAQRGLGLALAGKGDLKGAQTQLEMFLRQQPTAPDIWSALANILQQQGAIPQAIQAYQTALQQDPQHLDALNNFGLLLRSLGKLPESAALLQRAIQKEPRHPLIQFNFGVSLDALGKLPEAILCFTNAVALKPDFAPAWNNLGVLHQKNREYEKAEAAFLKAADAQAGYAEPLMNLAAMQAARGEIEAARQWYDKALAIEPDSARALIGRHTLLPTMMESVDAIEQTRRALDAALDLLLAKRLKLQDPLLEVGRTAFHLTYHGQNDVALQQKFADLYRKACPSLLFVAPHVTRVKPAGEKIRIGFISTFLHNHTIGKLNRGLIANLPRDRFEVEILTTAHEEDALRQSLREVADHFTVLPPHLFPARKIIADQQLDVAFYTDIGMEPFTYFMGFARLAPVQCVTWGHPVTTGLPHMHYFISSEHLDTKTAQAHYREKLIRLPHMAVAFPKPDVDMAGKTRADFGLSEAEHLYICPQSLFKFHPEFDAVLGDILRQDPAGRLLLIESKDTAQTAALKARFAKTIPAVTDRITYLSRLSGEDFIRVIALADVMLDPLHFGGGNTSYEAFAVGTPVVTLPSEFLRGRITYALYEQMDYTDLVAESLADYASLAVKLGTDTNFRKQASEAICSRHDRIFEDNEGVEQLADFLEEAVRKKRQKAA